MQLETAKNMVVKEKPRTSRKDTQNNNNKKKKQEKQKQKSQMSTSECNTFEYEVIGAPWWMPIDDTIDYQYSPKIVDQNQQDEQDKRAKRRELLKLSTQKLIKKCKEYNVKYDRNRRNEIVDKLLDKMFTKKNQTKEINTIIISKNQTVVDDYANDIYDMDCVKIVVNGNPWLQQQITGKVTNDRKIRQYVLSIEFQINCRKYILFTSLLLFIVVMTFLSSAYTGFYQLKGYTFNFIVIIILMYGIFVGFVCSEMNRYTIKTLLILLNVYWSMAWIIIMCLGITACIYLVLFPNKFTNYCKTRDICDASLGDIIFAEMSLFCTLILYIFMMFFYMQRIVNLVILISNIKEYQFKYENNCFMRGCHKHMYRYLRGWQAFRNIIGKHTGLRISDVLYCSCWFRKCRRNSSHSWQPASHAHKKKKKKKKKKQKSTHKDSTCTDSTASADDYKQQKRTKRSDIVCDTVVDYEEPLYTREQCCWKCCDNITREDTENGVRCCDLCLRDCWMTCDWRDVCSGCSECMDICNKENCCRCCGTYHTDDAGDCTICCKSIRNICGCDDCCDCCDCGECGVSGDCGDCGGCGDCEGCGEGALFICIGIIVAAIFIVTFLLPIIVFGCIAAPFWLLAQYVVWKLNDKVPWIIVIAIFLMFLIPPCFIWAYIWTTICLGNLTNKFMSMMCLIWSFFHTIYSSFS